MKTAAKVFVWIGMICFFYLIFPVVIGIFALQKIDSAKTKEDLLIWGIITLCFCSVLGGLFMLLIPVEELNTESASANNVVDAQATVVEKEKSQKNLEEELTKLQHLYEDKLITKKEYEQLKKETIKKHLD